MRPASALCLLALLVTGASLCSRRLPGRRRQALSPSPVRRVLTVEEAARLAEGRAYAETIVVRAWPGLSPEEAARLAMAWPHNTPVVSWRTQ